MESKGARLAVLAGAIGAVVALFFLLSDDQDQSRDPARVQTATESRPPDGDRPERRPKPEIPTVEVRGGQPVGGVQQLDYEAGESIRLRVSSDVDAAFHLHGYDIERGVSGGKPVTFDVPAEIEGVFELENHATGAPIAEISVSP